MVSSNPTSLPGGAASAASTLATPAGADLRGSAQDPQQLQIEKFRQQALLEADPFTAAVNAARADTLEVHHQFAKAFLQLTTEVDDPVDQVAIFTSGAGMLLKIAQFIELLAAQRKAETAPSNAESLLLTLNRLTEKNANRSPTHSGGTPPPAPR